MDSRSAAVPAAVRQAALSEVEGMPALPCMRPCNLTTPTPLFLRFARFRKQVTCRFRTSQSIENNSRSGCHFDAVFYRFRTNSRKILILRTLYHNIESKGLREIPIKYGFQLATRTGSAASSRICSFAPPGLAHFSISTQGLRPGLHSCAASRLRQARARACPERS